MLLKVCRSTKENRDYDQDDSCTAALNGSRICHEISNRLLASCSEFRRSPRSRDYLCHSVLSAFISSLVLFQVRISVVCEKNEGKLRKRERRMKTYFYKQPDGNQTEVEKQQQTTDNAKKWKGGEIS